MRQNKYIIEKYKKYKLLITRYLNYSKCCGKCQ